MKYILITLVLVFVTASCEKDRTVLVTGNKSTAAVGEEIVLSIDANSDKKFKNFVVDAILYSSNGVQNTGRIFFIEEKSKEVSDNIKYLIPNQVVNQQINPGDYYEFTIFAEIGNEVITDSWKVTITP